MIFSLAFDAFVQAKRSYVKPVTVSNSYHPAKRQFLRLLPDKELSAYTAEDMVEYVAKQLKNRQANGVNVDIRVLRTFGKWLAKRKLLDRDNVFQDLELLRVPAKPIKALKKEELTQILEAEADPMMRDIYIVAAATGARLSTVLSMKWAELDPGLATWTFVASKTGRTQVVPLHPVAQEVLGHRTRRTGEDPVWGRFYTNTHVSRRFSRAVRDAGLEGITFHTLRKTTATWLIQAGATIFEVQRLLGHSSPTVTARFYAEISIDQLQGTIQRLTIITGSVLRSERSENYASGMVVHPTVPLLNVPSRER